MVDASLIIVLVRHFWFKEVMGGMLKCERKDLGKGLEKGGSLLLDSQPDPRADLTNDEKLDRLQVKIGWQDCLIN